MSIPTWARGRLYRRGEIVSRYGVLYQATTNVETDAHSAHSGAGVDAHTVGQANAHSDHAIQAHTVGQASQHAAQSHSSHDSPNSEPAYYALAFIQKL